LALTYAGCSDTCNQLVAPIDGSPRSEPSASRGSSCVSFGPHVFPELQKEKLPPCGGRGVGRCAGRNAQAGVSTGETDSGQAPEGDGPTARRNWKTRSCCCGSWRSGSLRSHSLRPWSAHGREQNCSFQLSTSSVVRTRPNALPQQEHAVMTSS